MLAQLALALTALSAQADTLRLRAAEAMDLAVQRSASVAAAEARRQAASSGIGAARAWRNPTLSVTAENLGAQFETTGRDGLAGIEGQVTLTGWLPLGGDHGALVRHAEATALAASSALGLSERSVRLLVAMSVATASRDRVLAQNANEEAVALERFALQMTQRSDEGRTAGGEAARARLESSLAAARAARRAAEAASTGMELNRLLALGPDTLVVIETPVCRADPPPPGTAVELKVADAQVVAARAHLDAIKARGVPDLLPQIGWRRTGGFSGLLLGFDLDLPFLSRGRAATEAARADAQAAQAERDDLAWRLEAEQGAARAAVQELEAAGSRFDAMWRADLERTLSAAQTLYNAGEGSLTELLDARRARLSALDEYEIWRAERRLARARLARSAGAEIDASLLCDDDVRSAP